MNLTVIINVETDINPDSTELRNAELAMHQLYNAVRAQSPVGAGIVAYSNGIRAPGSRLRVTMPMYLIYSGFRFLASCDYAGQDLAGLSLDTQKQIIARAVTSIKSCRICGMPGPVVTRWYSTGDQDENTALAVQAAGLTPIVPSVAENGMILSDVVARDCGLSAEDWLMLLESEIDAGKDITLIANTSVSVYGTEWTKSFAAAMAYAKQHGYGFVNPGVEVGVVG